MERRRERRLTPKTKLFCCILPRVRTEGKKRERARRETETDTKRERGREEEGGKEENLFGQLRRPSVFSLSVNKEKEISFSISII